MKDWTVPCEPELLYLRQKIKRLEAENEYLRNMPNDYSLAKPPEILKMSTMPRTIVLPQTCRSSAIYGTIEGGYIPGYHVIINATREPDAFRYGYFSSYRDWQTVDILGLAGDLHRRTIEALAHTLIKR